jgi:F-box-like
LGNILQQLLIRCVVGQGQGQVITIDVLPDEVLLDIFDLCVGQDLSKRIIYAESEIEAWQILVHVCRRWRNIVFGSPLRLNLALLCTDKTPARGTLNVWPPLPLFIQSSAYPPYSNYKAEGVDNIVAGLERSDRVCQINLADVTNLHSQELLAALQRPFPELRHLRLSSFTEPVIPDSFFPDSFLGGSAPRLQYISLFGITFPGLPKLLLSATHLVDLDLVYIPHSGYISPDAMATTLSTLTCLERLLLAFQSPQSFPDQGSRRPPPPTRSVLPLLAEYVFHGVSDYMEYLVALIDVPQLNKLQIIFFNQIIFDTPQFIQFVNRTPTLKALEKAHVTFGSNGANVMLSSGSPQRVSKFLYVKIACRELDWQVSSLEQVCTSSLLPLFALEDLYVYKIPNSPSDWQDNIENALWLELFRHFPAVKNLYLDVEFAPRIMPALQELVGGRTTEVLPTLQNIFFEELQESGPVQEGILQFVAARQVTSHPIAVSLWEDSQEDKIMRY